MDLNLVDETATYDVALPRSYVEARMRLRNSGAILDEAINAQSDQARTAQMLTAQTMRDLGRGWETVFSWSAEDPSEPTPQEMSFRWQPQGELYLQFPVEMTDQFCHQGVANLLRAGEWQVIMRQASASDSLGELSSRFAVGFEERLLNPQWGVLESYVEFAATRIFEWIFSMENTGKPLFTSLKIDWGDGAKECLEGIHQNRSAGR